MEGAIVVSSSDDESLLNSRAEGPLLAFMYDLNGGVSLPAIDLADLIDQPFKLKIVSILFNFKVQFY